MTARALALALAIAALTAALPARAAQDDLVPDTDVHSPVLPFDWPDIQVGIGSYEAGPTGLTVIRFMPKAAVVVDSRGGAPGTVNTEWLRLGYDTPRMDAIVFAGGGSYGEEAVTAVMTGLKDDGTRSGAWNDMALAAGAAIYDLGDRRPNEIYPDKRLAQAALHALRPGTFPLGAQGAGRMAMQGSFFGCRAHSGQGAAFREIGGIKIAAFVVVNALGSIVDRAGNVVACHPAPGWGGVPKIAELMGNVPRSRDPAWDAGVARDEPTQRNTTVSLIVTNAKLSYSGLQRLAIQVHTSMARAIQPFSTFDDGDTLFAATTDRVPAAPLGLFNLDTIAGETMWDAILASVPASPTAAPPQRVTVPAQRLLAYAGTYRFGPRVRLKLAARDGTLYVTAERQSVFEFAVGQAVPLLPESDAAFVVDARYHTRLRFSAGADGGITGATLNPGRWEQVGLRVPD
jgi:L-aminopeptidase/D-esterase-like protein